jgi:nucleoside-diphosphate-sugar epimerase
MALGDIAVLQSMAPSVITLSRSFTMHVFVTGASGHIGLALIPELLGAGHQVTGLARSDASAQAIEAAGAGVHRGDLSDLDGLRAAAARADGVIHLAFRHDAMQSGDFAGAADSDLTAIEVLGEALAGSDKPLLTTSGTLMLAMQGVTGRAGTEGDRFESGYRVDAENATTALAEQGVRASVVRLPPTVHSHLDHHGFVPSLIAIARDAGTSGYLGDGANRWPAVHTLDAARLYRLALESAPAGSRLHAVADEGVPFREIAAAIARGTGTEAARIDDDQAQTHFGFLAGLVGLDNPTSGAITRELLQWTPQHPGLIADIDSGHYLAT